jgi:transposase
MVIFSDKNINPQYRRKTTMNQDNTKQIISVVHPVCCGLDVHKKLISACLIYNDSSGQEQSIIQEFDTFTDSLIKLREWLIEHNCPIVAMESTGIYWRPVHNILEEVVQVVLVNARHVKNVPGRKTDIADSRWLAGLLRHGLIKGSFIPPKHVREWRDITRYRQKHVQTLNDYKRRVHKLFESANIKIDSVLSDLFGATGRRLIALLADPEAEITLEDVKKAAHGRVRHKVPELFRSIQGHFTAHHAFMLRSLLLTISHHEQEIQTLDIQLQEIMSEHTPILEELDRIPGINEVTARAVLAEIGPDLDAFPSCSHLTSWAGLCPGNNESAGKRKGGRSPVKKHHLKTILVEAAWAATRKKDSYYKEKFHRLKSRRGPKKAIVAIAHRLLKAIYHVINFGTAFRDLGAQYLQQRAQAATLRNLRKQASILGMKLVPTAG